MPTTAAITLTINVVGLPEGSENFAVTLTNSTATGSINRFFITSSGIANATTVAVPTNARACLIVGPGAAGSSGILRLAASTLATTASALAIASTGFAFLPVCTTAGPSTAGPVSTVVLWSSGTVSTANPTRVSFW